MELYLRELLVTRKASTENRSRQILFEALPFIENTDPRQGVFAYLQSCRERGNDNHTLCNKLIRVKVFFKYIGVKLDIPLPKFAMRMPQIYSEKDMATFFAACDQRQTVYFRTLLLSGMRMQEARWLAPSDLMSDGIQICAKPNWVPKTHEERIIPMPASWMQVLRNHSTHALVFPTSLGNADCHALRTCKRIAKRAGLDPSAWSLHGFRRTCITTLLRKGLDVRTVMHIAGHKDMKSTMRYLRPLEGETLNQRLEAIWG